MSLTLRERNRRFAYRAIRDEAMRLFAEHGYDAVTIEMVAAQAGVSPSTVYRYFGTKELLAIGDDMMDPELLARLPTTATNRQAYLDTLCDVLLGSGEGSIAFKPQLLGYVRDIPDVRRTYFARLGDVAEVAARGDANRVGVQAMVRARAYVFGMSAALEEWFADGADEATLRDYLAQALCYLADLDNTA